MEQTALLMRQAAPADAALLREITREAYARWVPVIGREPLPMQADYGQAVTRHRFDLIGHGPEAVGLIETRIEPDHLWIENVAVRPNFQGLGLGRYLLGHAESLARAAGLQDLRLLTNEAFADNVAIYQRLGYAVERTEAFMGGTTLYLHKRLEG